VLISPAIAKSNPTKASPKAAILTVVIIARTLARSLQANANADTPIAAKPMTAVSQMQDRLPLQFRRRLNGAAMRHCCRIKFKARTGYFMYFCH
jgi:hypothetical protein